MELGNLNKAQQQAVLATDGPVMILAGAGSGKTKTLVTKIQYLLGEKKVSPSRILALTFSNKAAKEMRERVAKDSNVDMGVIQITTFHSFCSRLLRSEAQYLGLSRNFTIYDTSESKSVVKAILGKRGINSKEVHPSEVQYYVDGLKNVGHYLGCKDESVLEEIEDEDVFFDFYQEYEAELHKSNAVDFGGLITGVLNLFDNFPEVLERYQKRYHYLLVDEYQDTNRSQFKLVRLLSQGRKNICVVGDEDQSIYSWRGADIRNILEFEKIFPESQLIKLEQNYRSSKNIIEAASCVISKNEQRKGKELWTDNERGESLSIIECSDDRIEADFIAGEVKDLISKGADPREIAIFYRTNAQSRIIEDALRTNKISYRVVAGIKFYERKEVKDLLAYLRCIVNDKDALALSRIINTPTRGIGARTLRKIEDEAIKLDISLWEMMNKISDFPEDFKHLRLSAKVKSGINSFTSLIHEAKVLDLEKESPAIIYEKILNESGYLESLEVEKTYEAQGRIENLEELYSAIKQFQEQEKNASLLGFLETITLDSQANLEGEEEEKEVSMMTIHGSKGLEYHYVFLTGVEETVFPSFQSVDEGGDAIEEERRLFYVAMTRAMKKLFMSYAQGRMLWGSVRFNPPSRFIDEIPEKYYSLHRRGKSKNFSKPKVNTISNGVDYSDDFSQLGDYEDKEYKVSYTINSDIKESSSAFSKNDRVKHKLYGEGFALSVSGTGKSEKIVIQFNDGTKKKFMVEFAPIEKIKD